MPTEEDRTYMLSRGACSQTDRHTSRHAHHNTPLPYRGAGLGQKMVNNTLAGKKVATVNGNSGELAASRMFRGIRKRRCDAA